jgi:hypothetical protein
MPPYESAVTLKEEHSLKVFGKRKKGLSGMFGSKIEVSEEHGNLYN